jgi:hypothetical protein
LSYKRTEGEVIMIEIIQAIIKEMDQKASTKPAGYIEAINEFQKLLDSKLTEHATSIKKRNDNLIEQFLNLYRKGEGQSVRIIY